MIKLTRKEDCCGCSACEQVCPKQCINLESDEEGYWYPSIDTNLCIDCDLCSKTCPVLNQDKERIPLKVYAAFNKDIEVRSKSASGGIFSILAQDVINDGGVVFGVKFDENWNVTFGYTDKIDELDKFRRSKYVQAWLGDTFKKVKQFLTQGRKVLFTGTPCQIAGLRHFLRKDYPNLLLMDLICEGVPSPIVWSKYLNEEVDLLCKQNSVLRQNVIIEDISFRNKQLGWKQYSFSLSLSVIDEKKEKKLLPTYINRDSAYLQAMILCLDLRPICYACPFKRAKSGSDITVADYWGINILHPEMDDDKGTSMVYLNTPKGITNFTLDQVNCLETSYQEAFKFNNIITSAKKHGNRDIFFQNLNKEKSIIKLIIRYRYTRFNKFKLGFKKYTPSPLYKLLKKLWDKLKK